MPSGLVRIFVLAAAFATCLSGCDKTDEYYEKLRLEPEIYMLRGYSEVYGVGDTLTLQGRLLAPDLRIHIGDADAAIIDIQHERYPSLPDFSIQVVKLLITEAMGLGENRPVTITGAGITITGSSIVIIGDSKSGILPKPLTVAKVADYPVGYRPVYCRSGNGNMYFIDTAAVALVRIRPDGNSTTYPFSTDALKDNDGTPFAVTRFNGYGIDSGERYLYLSLYEEAPRRTYWRYYRLCRYDLQSGAFTVLNKTPYHIYRYKNTEATTKPFEGDIQDVKMFSATGIYPGLDGEVYFDMDGRMITHLDASGNYSYVFKNSAEIGRSELMDPAPQLYDEPTDAYKPEVYLLGILPGNAIAFSKIETLDPDAHQLYLYSVNAARLQQYDLLTREAGNIFNNIMNMNGVEKPYSAGPFRVLNYSPTINGLFGMMSLQKNRLLMLKFQGLYEDTYGSYDVPTWAIMDFEQQWGQLYAPGKFNSQGHVMNDGDDVLLNYDADGMLYMTSDGKTTILKTIYQ